MAIPVEFQMMCGRLDQDAPDTFPSMEAMIKYATADMTPGQLSAIKSYVDELLKAKHPDSYLRRLWREAGAGIQISSGKAGGIAEFFAIIRSVVIEQGAAG